MTPFPASVGLVFGWVLMFGWVPMFGWVLIFGWAPKDGTILGLRPGAIIGARRENGSCVIWLLRLSRLSLYWNGWMSLRHREGVRAENN